MKDVLYIPYHLGKSNEKLVQELVRNGWQQLGAIELKASRHNRVIVATVLTRRKL